MNQLESYLLKLSDYENPVDSNTDNIYSITVTATDAVDNSSSQLITIEILNTQEGPASFSVTGTSTSGETMSISEIKPDPDGNGVFSYEWQISSDNEKLAKNINKQ